MGKVLGGTRRGFAPPAPSTGRKGEGSLLRGLSGGDLSVNPLILGVSLGSCSLTPR